MFAHCTVGRAQLPEASRPYAAVGRKALMYVYCKFFRPQRKREDFQSSSPPPYFLLVLRFASRRVPNILEMQKKPQKRVAKRAHPFCASARSTIRRRQTA